MAYAVEVRKKKAKDQPWQRQTWPLTKAEGERYIASWLPLYPGWEARLVEIGDEGAAPGLSGILRL